MLTQSRAAGSSGCSAGSQQLALHFHGQQRVQQALRGLRLHYSGNAPPQLLRLLVLLRLLRAGRAARWRVKLQPPSLHSMGRVPLPQPCAHRVR